MPIRLIIIQKEISMLPLKKISTIALLALAASNTLAAGAVYSYRVAAKGVLSGVVAATPPPPVTTTSACLSGQSGCALLSETDKAVNVVVTNGLGASVTGGCGAACPSQYGAVHATVGEATGAYYWEVTSPSPAAAYKYPCGISPAGGNVNLLSGYDQPGGYGFYDSNPVANVVYGCKLDLGGKTFAWSRNGVHQAVVSIAPGTYFPSVSMYSTDVYSVNFGQKAFVYAVPAGFTAGFR